MTWQDKAKALWGELHWKATLAHMMDVNKSTVRRWNTGQHKMKPDVIDKISATYEICNTTGKGQ